MDAGNELATMREAYRRCVQLERLNCELLEQAWEERNQLRTELAQTRADLEAARQEAELQRSRVELFEALRMREQAGLYLSDGERRELMEGA